MSQSELYKDAILTIDLPAEGLPAGDVGTVEVVTIPASSLRVPTSADVPSVRELSKMPD